VGHERTTCAESVAIRSFPSSFNPPGTSLAFLEAG